MKLWLLVLKGRPIDPYCGHLVQAETEALARAAADASPGSKGMLWQDKDKTTCRELTAGTEPCFILHDFTSS